MDVKYLNPFLEAVPHILEQFGLKDVARVKLEKKETMHINMDITAVIGLTGKVRGNIAYSLSQKTATNIISTMLGTPVMELDELGRSGIGELANMFTGRAATLLSQAGVACELTPPSIIVGQDLSFVISSARTITVHFDTPAGRVEVNMGLEIQGEQC